MTNGVTGAWSTRTGKLFLLFWSGMITIASKYLPLLVQGSRGPHPNIANYQTEVLAVIGLCWMGFTDYTEIAYLAGIGKKDKPNSRFVRDVCESKLPLIRHALRHGLPRGVCGTLRHAVHCPQCRQQVLLAPCLYCTLVNRVGPN
jgi:hypothetical protein